MAEDGSVELKAAPYGIDDIEIGDFLVNMDLREEGHGFRSPFRMIRRDVRVQRLVLHPGEGAIASYKLGIILFKDKKPAYWCWHGRWHRSIHDANGFYKTCIAHFYDPKVAHDYARRLKYRIPHWWEWLVVAGSVAGGLLTKWVAPW